MKRGNQYPVAQSAWRHVIFKRVTEAVVEATGEFREPRKGEWFLSGAVVEGYYASNDLNTKYHIAKLVPPATTR